VNDSPEPISDAERASLAWRTATVAGVVLAIALSVFIVVYAASGFLLIFAGHPVRGLPRRADHGARPRPAHPSRHPAGSVCLVTGAAFAAFLAASAPLPSARRPTSSPRSRKNCAVSSAWSANSGRSRRMATAQTARMTMNDGGWTDWLPDPGLFGQVRVAFEMTFGVLGNIVVILVLGVFIAAQPQLYRDGLTKLVPPRSRRRFGQVLDEIGSTLRFWLIGQFITMTIIGLVVWAALAAVGMPGPSCSG
jgi:hypothetical protein